MEADCGFQRGSRAPSMVAISQDAGLGVAPMVAPQPESKAETVTDRVTRTADAAQGNLSQVILTRRAYFRMDSTDS